MLFGDYPFVTYGNSSDLLDVIMKSTLKFPNNVDVSDNAKLLIK